MTNTSVDFLGWDCANKSLAWTYITINLNIIKELHAESENIMKALSGNNLVVDLGNVIRELNRILDTFITFKSTGVVDILDGRKVKDVNDVDRSRALYNFIQSKELNVDASTIVIIERQNKIGNITNSSSVMISSQLVYNYITSKVVLINPKLKNKITMGQGLALDDFINVEIPRRKSLNDAKYVARKKHSKENYLRFLTIFGLLDKIKHIRKIYLDDVADSAMEIFAYIRENNLMIGNS